MLHPQARALLDALVANGIPPTHTLTPAQARAAYVQRRALTQPAPPDLAEVRNLTCPGPAGEIPLRLYRPLGLAAGERPPVLVYFHGGGWVIGDLDSHDTACRQLANGSRCAVVAVHYRLAPEHRFPGAVEDSIAAARWVQQHADELGVDGSRLAVGGDSAGGNLAAVVALAARDGMAGADGLAVAFQLLVYPATDQRRVHPSHTSNGEGYLLTRDTIRYFHDHYLPDARDDEDWRASPLLHASHAGLPPAMVLIAGHDPLRDEGLAYAQALTSAGNRATLVNFDRQIHGFFTMGRVIDEANDAVALSADALRRALRG